MNKQNLTTQRLISVGATKLGRFYKDNFAISFDFAKNKSKLDYSKPGIYFIAINGIVVARTYVGQQETNKGFADTVNRVKAQAYICGSGMPDTLYRSIWFRNQSPDVYFVPFIQVSRLLKVQQLELFEENCAKYQSLTAVSRQLFMVYNFEYQKR